jgi:hypothetical protein
VVEVGIVVEVPPLVNEVSPSVGPFELDPSVPPENSSPPGLKQAVNAKIGSKINPP